MNKYLFLLLPVILAGCTSLDSGLNNHYNPGNSDYGQAMVVDESRVFDSLSNFPFLESANPAPSSSGFATNDFIVLIFNEWGGYSGFSFALYERSSLAQFGLDTTTFDSFDGTDLGLIPFDSLGVDALDANTTYLLKMTNESDGTVYYYEFSTGEADTIKPRVESVRFQNNDLEILFSETVKSWTFKEDGNIVLKKDGAVFVANFDNVRTTAGYGWQNANYFIEYPQLVGGTYEIIVKNVQDASGNVMDDYSGSVVKE
jgi:hypothetical protein